MSYLDAATATAVPEKSSLPAMEAAGGEFKLNKYYEFLLKIGLSPDRITILGLLLGVLAPVASKSLGNENVSPNSSLLIPFNELIALGLISSSGICDVSDGGIARYIDSKGLRGTTVNGGKLDPVCDKAKIYSVILSLISEAIGKLNYAFVSEGIMLSALDAYGQRVGRGPLSSQFKTFGKIIWQELLSLNKKPVFEKRKNPSIKTIHEGAANVSGKFKTALLTIGTGTCLAPNILSNLPLLSVGTIQSITNQLLAAALVYSVQSIKERGVIFSEDERRINSRLTVAGAGLAGMTIPDILQYAGEIIALLLR